MKPMEILKRLGEWGPVWFGLGFLAPLTAQTLEAWSIEALAGASPIAVGLVLGGTLGAVAKLRGSWI